MIKFPVITLIIIQLTNYAFGKVLIDGQRKNVFQTKGRTVYIFGLAILALCAFALVARVIDQNFNASGWYWLTIVVVIMGFHAVMEWLFIKDSKEYVVSLISLFVGALATFIFLF